MNSCHVHDLEQFRVVPVIEQHVDEDRTGRLITAILAEDTLSRSRSSPFIGPERRLVWLAYFREPNCRTLTDEQKVTHVMG